MVVVITLVSGDEAISILPQIPVDVLTVGDAERSIPVETGWFESHPVRSETCWSCPVNDVTHGQQVSGADHDAGCCSTIGFHKPDGRPNRRCSVTRALSLMGPLA